MSSRAVPFRDLPRLHALDAERSRGAVLAAIDACDFTRPSRLLDDFEADFARYCGVRHAVATSSGSAALLLAYLALGIGPGDEVITVPNTFVATVEAARLLGADVVLADVEPESYAISVADVERLAGRRTKAIVPFHPFGRLADLEPLLDLARGLGVAVVEEACHAHGATRRGRRAGSFGDCAVFSLGPTKPLAGLGEGGAVVCDDDGIAERLRLLNNHGRRQGRHAALGLNFRMHPIEAAYLRQRLALLPALLEGRRELAARYNTAFAELGIVKNPNVSDLREHSFYVYVVEAPERAAFCRSLDADGIGWDIHYPVPIHRQEAHAGYFQAARLPVWDRIQPRIVSLPMIDGLTGEEAERTIRAVAHAVRECGTSAR